VTILAAFEANNGILLTSDSAVQLNNDDGFVIAQTNGAEDLGASS
jgi:hypothetical protein